MPNRILLVGNFLSHSRGHRHYCEELADRLEQQSWNVIRVSRHANRAVKLADMLRTTWTRRAEYDVAHCDVYSGAGFAWAELVGEALYQLGKPVVMTMHGGSLPEFASRWPRRARRLFSRATVVTSPSEYLRDAMEDHVRGVHVIPNGLGIGRYAYAPRSRVSPRLIWLRAFDRVYNPVMAVEVLAQLRRRAPEATLTMVGPDSGDGTLAATQRRARELDVETNVRIVGAVPNADVPRQLADADILLNTSEADNTPISMLEAMATGLCVVTTDVGGIPYLVEHEREALLVPRNDAAAAAVAIERLLHSPELAATISSGGRARAAQFDWPMVLDEWTQLLAPLVPRA